MGRTARRPARHPRGGYPLAECVRQVQAGHPDHAALHLLPDAPADVVKGAYRALALAHHPDHAGPEGHRAMVKINAAHERLTRTA